jgi:uncharacterized protein with gpF-like domain
LVFSPSTINFVRAFLFTFIAMPKGITPNELQAYKKEWVNRHALYEKKNYRVFKKALDDQIKPVVEEIKKRGISDIEKVLPLLISREPLQKAYKECYVKVGVSNALWIRSQINKLVQARKKESPLQFLSAKWKQLMQAFYENESSKRIVGVTDTTIENIQGLLSDARGQNLTISQQADYLVEKLEDKDFNRTRALRIARTESTAGANQGATLAAEESDYLVNKQWLAVIDNVTRPSHVEANGQIVGIDELFIVGDEEARYPGDLNLSAKEVINCRCSLLYVPVLDKNGLPILKA